MAEIKKFVFAEDKPGRTIDWPCTIPVPLNGGKVELQELVARFSLDHISADAHEKLGKEAMQALRPLDAYVVEKVLVGFPELQNANKESVTWETAKDLLRLPYVVVGVVHGYMEMREGRLPKNSLAPSAFS